MVNTCVSSSGNFQQATATESYTSSCFAQFGRKCEEGINGLDVGARTETGNSWPFGEMPVFIPFENVLVGLGSKLSEKLVGLGFKPFENW